MNGQQLRQRIDTAWTTFTESYGGLSEARLLQPGVTGEWSVRDIIAHVSWWEEEALKYLPLILEGGKPPRYSVEYGGIDAFNALMTRRRRALALSEVLQNQEETHRRLLTYLQHVPETAFARETRFRRRLRLDTYSHYPRHAKAIRRWRES